MDIKIVEVLRSVFPITPCVESNKLLLVFFGGQGSCSQRIIILAALVFFSFYLLSHLLVLLKVLDHIAVHFRCKTIPSVPFDLPAVTHLLDDIISSYSLVSEHSSNLARSLSALLLFVTHGSAIFAGSLAIVSSLMTLLSTVVPLL